MFNVLIDYLPPADELTVVMQTTSSRPEPIEPLFTGEDVIRFHEAVRKVPVAEEVGRFAVGIASATRPGREGTPDFIDQWVSWGAGLRAAQTLVLGGKGSGFVERKCTCQYGRHSGARTSDPTAPRAC